jgi:hypothetical protein
VWVVVVVLFVVGGGCLVGLFVLLQNNNDAAAFEKLLTIGASNYPGRIETIRAEVAKLEAAGHFGTKKYSAATNDLV